MYENSISFNSSRMSANFHELVLNSYSYEFYDGGVFFLLFLYSRQLFSN